MTAWWEGPLVGFDLETTSADPETARIVTACVVLDVPGQAPDVRSWLVDPGIEIPEGAAAVHGITTEQARAGGVDSSTGVTAIALKLDELMRAGVPLVAFNAAYDFTVLDREVRRHGHMSPLVPEQVIDPFVLDKRVDTYRRGKRTLGVTCEVYGVQLDDAHTAAADALAAVHLARAIARRYGDGPESAAVLHDLQVGWRAEQSASLQEYLRREDPTVVVDPSWPMHPAPAARLHSVAGVS